MRMSVTWDMVAFSGTVTVTTLSSAVKAQTSSAHFQANTARSTDAASTQQTYSSTLMGEGSRSGGSSSSSSSSSSVVRSAYSAGSVGWKGSLDLGVSPSSALALSITASRERSSGDCSWSKKS